MFLALNWHPAFLKPSHPRFYLPIWFQNQRLPQNQMARNQSRRSQQRRENHPGGS